MPPTFRFGLSFASPAIALSALAGCASSAPPPTTAASVTGRIEPEVVFSPRAAAAPPAPASPPPPGARVHIESEDPSVPLALYRVDREAGHAYQRNPTSGLGSVRDGDDRSSVVVDVPGVYTQLCLAPCDADIGISPAAAYFLGGDGIRSSSSFYLDPALGSVRIKAAPKSSAYQHGGTALAATGAAVLFVGSVFFFPGLAFHNPGTTEGGGVALGAGSALLGGGIALLLAGKTTYTIGPAATAWRF